MSNVELAKSSLADPDPMVRIGALDMLASAEPQQIWPLAAPLLSDPVRGVRIRAADLLAAIPLASTSPTCNGLRGGSGDIETRRSTHRSSSVKPNMFNPGPGFGRVAL